MYCPKCGKENPGDVKVCSSCGSALTQSPQPAQKPVVKTSGSAVAAFVLAFLSPIALLIATSTDSVPHAFIGIAAGISSLILGVISLVRIELSAGRLAGRGFAIIGITIPLIAFFLLQTQSTLYRSKYRAYRLACGTNLYGIGKSMLIYANDYDNELPLAGGRNTPWGLSPIRWNAANRADAFGLDASNSGGSTTISSCFYLLVKFAHATPKRFLCKGDSGTVQFKLSDYDAPSDFEYRDAWDFGPEPTKHCSYSYHMPYSPYPLTMSSNPGMAIAADRNPWIKSPAAAAKDFSKFDPRPTASQKARKYGNAIAHKGEGQQVLFMDIHVDFEKRPFCGIKEDNIYTYWEGQDIKRGAPPMLGSQPANRLDSLLVHDQPVADKK